MKRHPNVELAWRTETTPAPRRPTQRAPRVPPPSRHPDVVMVWRAEIDLEATAANVIASVAESAGVSVAEIRGPSRGEQPVADARAVAMWRLRELTGAPLTEIGRVFGRHHTTVLHAIARVQADIDRERGSEWSR